MAQKECLSTPEELRKRIAKSMHYTYEALEWLQLKMNEFENRQLEWDKRQLITHIRQSKKPLWSD